MKNGRGQTNDEQMPRQFQTKREALAEWLMLEYDLESAKDPTDEITDINWSDCQSTSSYDVMLQHICKLYNVKNQDQIVPLSQLKFDWNEHKLKDVEFKVYDTTVYGGYPGTTIQCTRKRTTPEPEPESEPELEPTSKRAKNTITHLNDLDTLVKEFNWVMSLEMDKKRIQPLFPDTEPIESTDPDVKYEWQFKYNNTPFSIYQLKNQSREWDLAVESGADPNTVQDLVDDLEFYFDHHCTVN